MTDVLLGPVLGLVSLDLYRRAATQSIGHGLAYLGWLSFLFGSLVAAALSFVWLPAVDDFVSWLGARLPEMQLTTLGIETEAPVPVVLTHPELGKVLVVDTSKDIPTPEEMAGTPVFVGRTHVTLSNTQRGESRVIALTGPDAGAQQWVPLTINGRLVHDVYGRLRPFVGPIVFLSGLVFFFVWKLLAALAYSAMGLGLNRFRSVPLRYAGILNVTIFAMTPVIVIQAVTTAAGLNFRLRWFAAWTITGIYMAVALSRTEARGDAAGTVESSLGHGGR